jgi:hypothetical protein
MAEVTSVQTDRVGGRGTLGILWILYGILRLAGAVWLMFFSTTATLMFGALMSRVPNPFTLMADFHLIWMVVIVWSGLCGLLGLLGGLALMAGQGVGRTLVVIAAFLALAEVPFGIMLGVYTLVVFLRGRDGSHLPE